MSHTRRVNPMRGGALAAVLLCAAQLAPVQAQMAGPAEEPAEARSAEPANRAVHRAAQAYRGTKILVSTNERRLRLIVGRDTIMNVPVGIGMGTDFEYEGRKFRFETPTGRRSVRSKQPDPVWTVPDWHYMEKAAHRGLELVRLEEDDEIELSDGSHIVVRDGQVGRVNHFGNFWAFTPGTEIIFDGRIFMPPFSTAQRRVPDALGPYKLDLGDGYLLHGTNPFNEDTVGGAVSHGCIRLTNEDVDRLYHLVDVGTPVFIY
ncbi:MAG TPA: L,D-transpeptidase [Longimicrobiales bacterium]